jgi:hypothetical protein
MMKRVTTLLLTAVSMESTMMDQTAHRLHPPITF